MRPLYNTLISKPTNYWNFHHSIKVSRHCPTWERATHMVPNHAFSSSRPKSIMILDGIDSLPSPINLCRCPVHNTRPCTVNYILNCCPIALNQEQYTWCHDSSLAHLSKILQSYLPEDTTLYADLPGLWVSDNPPLTVPTLIIPTSASPHIAIT